MSCLLVYLGLLAAILFWNYCAGEINHRIANAQGEDYYAP